MTHFECKTYCQEATRLLDNEQSGFSTNCHRDREYHNDQRWQYKCSRPNNLKSASFLRKAFDIYKSAYCNNNSFPFTNTLPGAGPCATRFTYLTALTPATEPPLRDRTCGDFTRLHVFTRLYGFTHLHVFSTFLHVYMFFTHLRMWMLGQRWSYQC